MLSTVSGRKTQLLWSKFHDCCAASLNQVFCLVPGVWSPWALPESLSSNLPSLFARPDVAFGGVNSPAAAALEAGTLLLLSMSFKRTCGGRPMVGRVCLLSLYDVRVKIKQPCLTLFGLIRIQAIPPSTVKTVSDFDVVLLLFSCCVSKRHGRRKTNDQGYKVQCTITPRTFFCFFNDKRLSVSSSKRSSRSLCATANGSRMIQKR